MICSCLHVCLQLFPSLIFQVFGFQAGLTWQDTTGKFLPLIPIIPSFSTALYGKLIQLPVYWWVDKECGLKLNEVLYFFLHQFVKSRLYSLIQNKLFLKHLRKNIITIVKKTKTKLFSTQQHNHFNWIWVTCLTCAFLKLKCGVVRPLIILLCNEKHGILRYNSWFSFSFFSK